MAFSFTDLCQKSNIYNTGIKWELKVVSINKWQYDYWWVIKLRCSSTMEYPGKRVFTLNHIDLGKQQLKNMTDTWLPFLTEWPTPATGSVYRHTTRRRSWQRGSRCAWTAAWPNTWTSMRSWVASWQTSLCRTRNWWGKQLSAADRDTDEGSDMWQGGGCYRVTGWG